MTTQVGVLDSSFWKGYWALNSKQVPVDEDNLFGAEFTGSCEMSDMGAGNQIWAFCKSF